jgi:hypothetical protein
MPRAFPLALVAASVRRKDAVAREPRSLRSFIGRGANEFATAWRDLQLALVQRRGRTLLELEYLTLLHSDHSLSEVALA